LGKYNDEKKIDIVIISGDLVDKGGQGYTDTYKALCCFDEKFIKPISHKIDVSNSMIFIAPGNHDINRNADKPYIEEGLEKYLSNVEVLNKFIDESNADALKRIEGYKKFESEFYDDYENGTKSLSLFESSFIVEVNHMKIGVTAFNSAWRCYSDKDKGKLLIGERQITNTRKTIENANLKIAILHHPFDWIADYDRKNIISLFHHDYDLVFYGHSHETSVQHITSLQGKVLHLQSPSNWTYNLRSTDIINSNGYMIMDYVPEDGKILIHHRLYSHLNEAYVPNVIVGGENGIEKYNIPTSDDLARSMQFFIVALLFWAASLSGLPIN
jgi:predicted phosphodiesterase